MTLPREMRALGLVMRELEQYGFVESTPELGDIVAASGFSPEEIDTVFHLLVTDDGLTVGGTADVSELDGFRVGQLVLDDLIDIRDDGRWTLTPRGQKFSALLDEYSHSKRQWRALAESSHAHTHALAVEVGDRGRRRHGERASHLFGGHNDGTSSRRASN